MNIFNFFTFKKRYVVLIILALCFRSSFFENYKISSATMKPNYEIGKTIYANKMAYNFFVPLTRKVAFRTGTPARGDTVMYQNPETKVPFVGRIIGVPKDQVSLNSEGWPIVNNKELKITLVGTEIGDIANIENKEANIYLFNLDEKYLYKVKRHNELYFNSFSDKSFILKDEEYFIMADNFDISRDSRHNGPVNHRDLLGRVLTK